MRASSRRACFLAFLACNSVDAPSRGSFSRRASFLPVRVYVNIVSYSTRNRVRASLAMLRDATNLSSSRLQYHQSPQAFTHPSPVGLCLIAPLFCLCSYRPNKILHRSMRSQAIIEPCCAVDCRQRRLTLIDVFHMIESSEHSRNITREIDSRFSQKRSFKRSRQNTSFDSSFVIKNRHIN